MTTRRDQKYGHSPETPLNDIYTMGVKRTVNTATLVLTLQDQ